MRFPKKYIENTKVIPTLRQIFSGKHLARIGRISGFFKRTGKLTPLQFVKMCVFVNLQPELSTLTNLCSYLKKEYHFRISPQALCDRFNKQSVKLLKTVFEEMLSVRLVDSLSTQDFEHFNSVRIADATSYQLPDQLAHYYKGIGGSSTGSSIKLYYEYDLKSGSFLTLFDGNGKDNEQKYQYDHNCAPIQPGDLELKDLGFFKLDYFKQLQEKGAYYISRYRYGVNVYVKQDGKMVKKDLLTIAKQCKNVSEIEVYLGAVKLKVRMIIVKLPKQAADQKRRKLKSAKRKNLTKERLNLCGYNFFITNVEHQELSAEKVALMYTLRWQIEIMFKIWKTLFSIDQTKAIKLERFQCILYGCLIRILVCGSIVNTFRKYYWEQNQTELSQWKGYSLLKVHLKDLSKAISKSKKAMLNYLRFFNDEWHTNGIKARKRIRTNKDGTKEYKLTPWMIYHDCINHKKTA